MLLPLLLMLLRAIVEVGGISVGAERSVLTSSHPAEQYWVVLRQCTPKMVVALQYCEETNNKARSARWINDRHFKGRLRTGVFAQFQPQSAQRIQHKAIILEILGPQSLSTCILKFLGECLAVSSLSVWVMEWCRLAPETSDIFDHILKTSETSFFPLCNLWKCGGQQTTAK